MDRLLERVRRGEVLVGDGAWGTQLMARGLKPGECPEAVNLDRSQLLVEIARLYVEAGAELITTNTFGGSPLKLALYGLAARTEEVNRRAVEAAREATAGRAYVSASVGPCGRLLKPYGDTEPDEVAAGFARQVRALAAAGADAICVETMTDLREATLAVRAAKAEAPHLPVIATMTFDPTPRGYFTIMGVTVEQAAAGLAEAGADLVGSNCGNGIERMVEIAEVLSGTTSLPLVIQSNAGLPVNRGGEIVYPETPEYMAERARRLLDLRVAIIGGCCGTGPEHIRALHAMVDAAPGRR